MRSRLVLILILFGLLWSAMVGRAAFLQLLPNERFEAMRKRQFETVVTLRSRRGDVLDRKGREFAISTNSHSLFADPKLIADPRRAARALAKHLKIPSKTLYEKLKNRKKRFVWLQRHLDRPMRETIEGLHLKGLGFIEESKRTYPNEALLAPVLGFVGSDGQGLEGIEAGYDDRLAANRRNVSVQRDARGRPLIVGGQLFSEAPDGADLHLTVDREIQFTLEQELRAAVVTHDAESATGVVLDAQTSEVLAMASAPAFDPNRPGEARADRRRNRVVTDAFEPGSTMKTFVIGAALAKGLIEPNSKFDCENGVMRLGRRVIRDDIHQWKILTVAEILAHSSNIGASKIAFRLGARELRASLEAFGFGDKTGIDLPGEAKGILQRMPWREHLLSNISFGHGISATPLQIANAYAAVANGGWLKRPYIVRRIHNHESGETLETHPKTLRRVLTADAAAKLRLMLASATAEDATGWNARVTGFPVAGKTGTAQKVNPNGRGYLPNTYISSFAGFFPANQPKFVIYVAVDSPRKGYYGSQVAAPVFSRVAAFAARHAGLSPILISESDLVRRRDALTAVEPNPPDLGASLATASAMRVVPELNGLTLREVVRRMSGSGVELRVRGRGYVKQTTPSSGAALEGRKTLTVELAPMAMEESAPFSAQ